MYGFGLVPGTVFLGTPFFVLVDQLCSGEVVVSPGIPRRRSSRDFWIVFNGFEVDALQRSSGAPVDVDFLEEQVRGGGKPPGCG